MIDLSFELQPIVPQNFALNCLMYFQFSCWHKDTKKHQRSRDHRNVRASSWTIRNNHCWITLSEFQLRKLCAVTYFHPKSQLSYMVDVRMLMEWIVKLLLQQEEIPKLHDRKHFCFLEVSTNTNKKTYR